MNPFDEFHGLYGLPAGEEGPARFVRDMLGATADPWQEEILAAIGLRERQIAVRSCHGVGKTTLSAWLINYMLCCRFPQKTIATSASAGQLKGALIPETKRWLNKLPPALRELFRDTTMDIKFLPAPEESFFEARTSRKENPEALQGVHSANVLLICDEASGIPEEVFKSARGSMAGTGRTMLLTGNPLHSSGFFFEAQTAMADQWRVRRVGHEESERVDPRFVKDIARQYGEDSNEFRVRCLGEFPKSDDDVLIPFGLVESAREREIEDRPDAGVVWGLDVARFGSDRTVLLKRSARKVHSDIRLWQGKDTMETAGRVYDEWKQTPLDKRPQTVFVDVIGIGSGVADRLRELGLPIRDVNVAESASSNERFRNLRSELWWEAREWLDGKDVSLPKGDKGSPAEELQRELTTPKYGFPTGRIEVESKADMKKRGFKSPDIADALILTFAGTFTKLMGGAGPKHYAWDKPLPPRHTVLC